MRTIYRFDKETGKMVEVYHNDPAERVHVVPDIEPYKSMITGEMITGRAQHREHLRRHDCVEVGNEKQTPKPYEIDRTQVKNDIREAKRQLEWGEAPRLEQLREMTPHVRRGLGLDD